MKKPGLLCRTVGTELGLTHLSNMTRQLLIQAPDPNRKHKKDTIGNWSNVHMELSR